MSQEDFARALDVHKNTVANYEKGGRVPDADYLNNVLRMIPDINPSWLLTGEGEMRGEAKPSVSGNGIIQGDSNHIRIAIRHPMRRATDRVSESSVEYGDPVSLAFLRDWLSLPDVARMRVWTMVKEEIERGKVEGKYE